MAHVSAQVISEMFNTINIILVTWAGSVGQCTRLTVLQRLRNNVVTTRLVTAKVRVRVVLTPGAVKTADYIQNAFK